jgi:hypothetical protein
MASYAIVPSTLDIQFVRGDEFGMLLDFDVNLTGYTFDAIVYEVGSVTNGVISGVSGSFDDFTITVVDLATGRLNLSLTEEQTQAFDLTRTYRWYLRWTAPGVVKRTVLSGGIAVGDP